MTTKNVMFSIADGIAKGSLNIDFIYCLEEGRFYAYMEGYWRLMEEREINLMIIHRYDGSKIDEKTSWQNVTHYSVSMRGQILENMKDLIFKKLSIFNKTGFLNFDQGELDPETGYIHPHNKDNYSTFRMPYKFRLGTECKLWLKTLSEIFEKDQDKINILQEFFGYCLTRDTRKEKALLLLGESRTGKSTILETLSAMLGEQNCASVPLTEIYNPQYTPLLMNKLVNIDTDVSGKADSYEAQFKTITSGEPIACNPKYVAPYTFRPYCKLIMAANEFPRITDHSSAFYKRLILLPCDRIFDDNEQNLRLKDELTSELCGIFNWANEGLHRLSERGNFERKEFMMEAVEDLRLESNPTEVFFKEYIEPCFTGENVIGKTELYEKYKQWSINMNQQYALSAIRFSQSLYRKYSKFTPKNSKDVNGDRVWRNLKYKTMTNTAQENLDWER